MSDIASDLTRAGVESTKLVLVVFLFRALRYAGHANRISQKSKTPVAYSASPDRITGLKFLLSEKETDFLQYVGSGYWDLIDRLCLPKVVMIFVNSPKPSIPLWIPD